MKYPAPPTPSASKEMDELIKQISRYQKGSSQIRTKLSKLRAAHKSVTQSIRVHEVLAVTSQKDAITANEELNLVKQQLRDFEAQLHKKENQFQDNMFALEELKEGISNQTEEVWGRINALHASCLDWRFAHQLNSDVCSNARTHAFGCFYRWALVQPLLRIWMATDSQVHRTTYATAHYEGVYEQLMAHFEVKDSIEQFGEDHYAVYKDTEDLVRTVKQATEERQARTELLDHVHVTAARKLQRLVSSCKALQKEIDQRESLRFKLNGLMMELSNALETDLRSSMEVCENEATKPSGVTVTDLRRAVLEGTLVDTTAVSGSDPFGAAEADGDCKVAPSPLRGAKDTTLTNTALNAVSKLPLLIKPGAARNVGPDGQRESTAESGNGTQQAARPSMQDSVYAQLPQYDNSAIAYVQSFHAPRRTKTYKWCKSSAKEASRCAQLVFPVVKGPVELVVPAEEEECGDLQGSLKPVAPGSPPKSNNAPSFRRRAGHSSKNPLAGGIAVNANFFVRERASVGSAGMMPEFLNLHVTTTADTGEVAGGRISPGSPTETPEDHRRRALKFMLNNRETHYDLLEREVVDAVTMLQMEQARAAAAARQRMEHEAAHGGAHSAATDELATHQYRTHQLLTDDYTGRQQDSGQNSAGEEYSLYVSLPEMSALTALTARQAVRTMQQASADITFETISKISQVLQDATSTAIASRAGTADGPHRVLGASLGHGPAFRPTPPHSPTAAQRLQARQFSNTLASATSSRGRMATLEDTLEAQTASALDAAPIETQAQDLSERVAAEFRTAREAVEDWIETHVQCNYKCTKRSLIELISNLHMDLHVPLDKDESYHLNSDNDESSVEALRLGPQATARPLTPSRSLTGGGHSPVSMNMTLKNMLEVSKSLIGSIQQNLREFAEKSHDSRLPDDITLHRRPNSAGALAGLAAAAHSSGAGLNGEEHFFEDDGDEAAFDPNDYAFTRRSPSARGASRDNPSATTSSPGRAPFSPALGATTAWPTKRTLLNSMESIICGELFVVDFYWNPSKTNTELIAKYYVSKNKYRQCHFVVTPHMISDLTNTPRDLALHTLFHDTSKVTHAIIASLTNETVDEHFYSEIVRAYKHHQGEEFEPQWPLMVIEEMLHPKNITSRRGSISQLYRPSSSEKVRGGSPEKRMSKHIESALQESGMVGKREYEFLMHILTIRKKSGELLAYSFPTAHEIAPVEPLTTH